MKAHNGVFIGTVGFLIISLYCVNNSPDVSVLLLVVAFGALGAVLREQISLRNPPAGTPPQPSHWIAITCIPLTGAVLAIVSSAFFVSGLATGGLFPKFTGVEGAFQNTFVAFREIKVESNGDLFKLIGWSIVSGFSERLVTERLRRLAGELQR